MDALVCVDSTGGSAVYYCCQVKPVTARAYCVGLGCSILVCTYSLNECSAGDDMPAYVGDEA
jgi:hypothetical protein